MRVDRPGRRQAADHHGRQEQGPGLPARVTRQVASVDAFERDEVRPISASVNVAPQAGSSHLRRAADSGSFMRRPRRQAGQVAWVPPSTVPLIAAKVLCSGRPVARGDPPKTSRSPCVQSITGVHRIWLVDHSALGGKSNINKNLWGSDMDRDRIVYIIKLALVLIGMSVLLPACVSTGSSTSGHVDARLREHGV